MKKLKYFCIETNCDKNVWHKNSRCRIHAEKYKKYPSRKGKNNLQYKDGRTLKKYYCKICRQKISYSSALYGKTLCQSCAKKIKYKNPKNHPMFGKKRPDVSIRVKGKNNPMFIHGKCNSLYPLGWTKTFKEQIRYRDGYKCQNSECGIPEVECIRKLDVHHIDYNKENLDVDNLISLCHKCHMKTNENRNYWYTYFIDRLNVREVRK